MTSVGSRFGLRLKIKAVPGASNSEISGWLGDSLKVRVAAPAERGKANAALEAYLAIVLEVPKRCVKVIAGHSQPNKTVAVETSDAAALMRRLPPK